MIPLLLCSASPQSFSEPLILYLSKCSKLNFFISAFCFFLSDYIINSNVKLTGKYRNLKSNSVPGDDHVKVGGAKRMIAGSESTQSDYKCVILY